MFHFHKWSNWSTKDVYRQLSEGRLQGKVYVQSRKCEKCGLEQFKRTEIPLAY